jgi:hypothetical protein
MHISSLKNSNFLKKEDCDRPVLVTISNVTQENVAKEGAPQELKWCLHLEEFDKPMVLNSTNGQLIARITGSEETDDWTGSRIVLYHDPSVSFGGKIIGGIRVRAPKKGAIPTPVPAAEEADDSIPF